jgi:hypothetical protein
VADLIVLQALERRLLVAQTAVSLQFIKMDRLQVATTSFIHIVLNKKETVTDSVTNPRHFDVDPDPDPRIHASD